MRGRNAEASPGSTGWQATGPWILTCRSSLGPEAKRSGTGHRELWRKRQSRTRITRTTAPAGEFVRKASNSESLLVVSDAPNAPGDGLHGEFWSALGRDSHADAAPATCPGRAPCGKLPDREGSARPVVPTATNRAVSVEENEFRKTSDFGAPTAFAFLSRRSCRRIPSSGP